MPLKGREKTKNRRDRKDSDRQVEVQFTNLTLCAQTIERRIPVKDFESSWTILRIIHKTNEIEDGDYVLANDRLECTRRARDQLRSYQQMITSKDQRILKLQRADEERRLFNDISQSLRWFANFIILPMLKRIYPNEQYIQRWSDFTECLHYLGPFVNRDQYAEELQNTIMGIVEDYGISFSQWFTLYAINKKRNDLYHRPVNLETVRSIAERSHSLKNQNWEEATHALVTALRQIPESQFTTMTTHLGRRSVPNWFEENIE